VCSFAFGGWVTLHVSSAGVLHSVKNSVLHGNFADTNFSEKSKELQDTQIAKTVQQSAALTLLQREEHIRALLTSLLDLHHGYNRGY
jgi:hypothetical protein